MTRFICQHMLTVMKTSVGADDGGAVGELAAIAEAKRELSRGLPKTSSGPLWQASKYASAICYSRPDKQR